MNASPSSIDHLQRALEERAPEIAEDPRVRPTLRIGGIGHRAIAEDAAPAVSATLAGLLAQIRQAAESVLQHDHAARAFSGPLELFAITPLSEGADVMIARAALAEGYRLGAIIPFAAEQYEETFDLSADRVAAVREFRALFSAAALPHGYGVLVLDGSFAADRRTNSYRDCGVAITSWSDILVAILREDRWDSETGLSVREAIKQGVAVVVIDPNNPANPRMAFNGVLLPAGRDISEELVGVVSDLFGIGTTSPETGRVSRRLEHYCAETIDCDLFRHCDFETTGPFKGEMAGPALITWCAGLNGAIAGLLRAAGTRRPLPTARDNQTAYASDMAFEAATAMPFVTLFLRQHRADVLATAYAELHRSAQILTVLLGVSAATFAIASFYFSSEARLLQVLELACLIYALVIVRVAHVEGWLGRWLNYRLLAEVLRYGKYLMVCGHPMSFSHFGQTGEAASIEHNWIYNHCRQVLRSVRIAMPGRTAVTDDRALGRVSVYLVRQCLDGQIGYHEMTASLRGTVARVLQRLAIVVAVISVVFVLVQLLLAFVPSAPTSSVLGWLQRTFSSFDAASILLPTLAGALLGLRGYGEHSVIGKRSGALVKALERRRKQICASESIVQLQEQMSAVAATLLRDVDGWLELFADKHIEV
jgi:hypothetical protein